VTIDTETSEMIKKRFGEEFFNQINGKLEVRTAEQTKRNDYKNKKRGDRK
jgi:hypothetical protein